jgi:hypothetical protein
MSTDTRYVPIVLDASDCQTVAQALRVFALQLMDDCRRDTRLKDIPAEVASQAQRLEAMAATLAGISSLDCSWEGLIFAAQRGEPHKAFDLSPADWRAVSAAMALLAEKVRAAGDRPNGGRLKDLSEKAKGIGDWCVGLLDCLRQLEEAAEELR